MSTVATDHDAIRPEPPKTYYDDVLKIPGFGKPPDRCRPMKPVGFCDHGHPILGRSSCGNRSCPDHWRDWIEDAVINMVARLAAYRHARQPRMVHVVASPPQDRRYSLRAFWEARSDAYDALEAAGVAGGATVPHGFRTNDRGNALFETAVEAGEVGESTGRWRFLRDLADDFEDLSRYIEPAPHYHALAAAEDVDGEAAPGDWVVKRIRSFKPFYYHDTEAYRDMAATAYYVLTHGAVQSGRQTGTYFGAVHPGSGFDPEEELTTTAWDRIQREAEKAVKTTRDEPEGETAAGPEECPRDDCEAAVHDVMFLREFLEDEDWVAEIRATRDGRKRLLRLRGMVRWWDKMTDRPPPGVLTSEERLLEWLENQGQTVTPDAAQVGLQTAVMSGP